MAHSSNDVLRGALDLLIPRTLEPEPMHGWGASRRIEELSEDALQVGQGSLYPALQRSGADGWITSELRRAEENRRAKYYRLTKTGRRATGEGTASWPDYVQAVERILEAT